MTFNYESQRVKAWTTDVSVGTMLTVRRTASVSEQEYEPVARFLAERPHELITADTVDACSVAVYELR